MKKLALMAGALVLAACAPTQSQTAPTSWVTLDPQNLLVIDTSKGRMIVEMRPDLAPKAVEGCISGFRDGSGEGRMTT